MPTAVTERPHNDRTVCKTAQPDYSFTAKKAICCSYCILVPGDVNMYQIAPN